MKDAPRSRQQDLALSHDEYAQPHRHSSAVPLRYDLEPYNFLRVEGHLLKNYRHVLNTLLLLKSDFRLPIEIVALRSGAYDDNQPIDLSKESARFQDLRGPLRRAARGAARRSPKASCISMTSRSQAAHCPADPAPSVVEIPRAELSCVNGYRRRLVRKYLTLFQSRPYIDVNQNQIDNDAVLTVYCTLFAGTAGLPDRISPTRCRSITSPSLPRFFPWRSTLWPTRISKQVSGSFGAGPLFSLRIGRQCLAGSSGLHPQGKS